MAEKFNPAEWRSLGGTSRNYENIKTGDRMSRRAFDALKNGISYEAKAAHNKALNPELQALRPARGRRSHVRSDDWIKKEIAAQRLEAKRLKEEAEKKRKEAAALERKNVRLSAKKIRVKKVKKHLIPKGQIGWRIGFNDYSELAALLADARKTGVIFAYGLGFVGVDERVGELRPVTVFRMMAISTNIPESEFNDAMEAALQEYSYIRPAHFFVHFAIDKNFVKSRK